MLRIISAKIDPQKRIHYRAPYRAPSIFDANYYQQFKGVAKGTTPIGQAFTGTGQHLWPWQKKPYPSPGQHQCAVCGEFLPNGGVSDTQGAAQRGPNALLCPTHARQYGIQNSDVQSQQQNIPEQMPPQNMTGTAQAT